MCIRDRCVCVCVCVSNFSYSFGSSHHQCQCRHDLCLYPVKWDLASTDTIETLERNSKIEIQPYTLEILNFNQLTPNLKVCNLKDSLSFLNYVSLWRGSLWLLFYTKFIFCLQRRVFSFKSYKAVSYTHLDVYKRQVFRECPGKIEGYEHEFQVTDRTPCFQRGWPVPLRRMEYSGDDGDQPALSIFLKNSWRE